MIWRIGKRREDFHLDLIKKFLNVSSMMQVWWLEEKCSSIGGRQRTEDDLYYSFIINAKCALSRKSCGWLPKSDLGMQVKTLEYVKVMSPLSFPPHQDCRCFVRAVSYKKERREGKIIDYQWKKSCILFHIHWLIGWEHSPFTNYLTTVWINSLRQITTITHHHPLPLIQSEKNKLLSSKNVKCVHGKEIKNR